MTLSASTAAARGVAAVPPCPVCRRTDSTLRYPAQRDYLYGTPGEWSYRECRSCGVAFLDPRPDESSIGAGYVEYPTHAPPPLPNTLPRRVRGYVRTGYLARAFGYGEGVSRAQRLAGLLAHVHPGQREMMNGSVMYLPAARRGRVLDVGCGAAANLRELRRLGWQVHGVEPDPVAAARAAQQFGLDVRAGTLAEQRFPAGAFDAVIMVHVLEHVLDPAALLAECRRVLAPGGLLVVATPNVTSFGRARFGPSWRGFEAPRHLTLFSPQTLARVAVDAGLSGTEVRTTVRGADGIFLESRATRRALLRPGAAVAGGRGERVRSHAYQYLQAAVLRRRPNAGEELLLTATA